MMHTYHHKGIFLIVGRYKLTHRRFAMTTVAKPAICLQIIYKFEILNYKNFKKKTLVHEEH